MELIVLPSAAKHGIADDDISHAVRNHIAAYAVEADVTMLVGPARNGRLLEVGIVESDEAIYAIHAMPAREKFLR